MIIPAKNPNRDVRPAAAAAAAAAAPAPAAATAAAAADAAAAVVAERVNTRSERDTTNNIVLAAVSSVCRQTEKHRR